MLEPHLIIRNIETIKEIQEVENIQRETWGMNDVTPLTNLVAVIEVGGILIGAFDNEKLVGMAYGFVGLYKGELEIHSHMLAVKPEYKRHELGYKLKQAQREEALRKGFKRMTWTFDPLQSRNAHLNLHKLGVIADEYKPDYYGTGEQNELHRGIGTDRLWVTWFLEEAKKKIELSDDGLSLIRLDADNEPECVTFDDNILTKQLLIQIPKDIIKLREENLELARQWRTATREAFTKAFSLGYYVTDYIRSNDGGEIGGSFVLIKK